MKNEKWFYVYLKKTKVPTSIRATTVSILEWFGVIWNVFKLSKYCQMLPRSFVSMVTFVVWLMAFFLSVGLLLTILMFLFSMFLVNTGTGSFSSVFWNKKVKSTCFPFLDQKYYRDYFNKDELRRIRTQINRL